MYEGMLMGGGGGGGTWFITGAALCIRMRPVSRPTHRAAPGEDDTCAKRTGMQLESVETGLCAKESVNGVAGYVSLGLM